MNKDKLKLIPFKPGCYLMKDSNNQIIYVGKAKNLYKRITSYFTGAHDLKTSKLIDNITDFEYIITNNETESLILELNLIKQYQPKYNILLKDDKSYPYIEITNEKIPRLNIVRTIKKGKSKLFGPYPNVYAAREIVNLLNRIYPLRKCNAYPKTPCLYYHIDQCLGYCINSIEPPVIDQMISDITKFLNGDHSLITKKIKEEIAICSESMQYEKCIELKKILDYIEVTLNRQKINTVDFINRDIFGYYAKNGYLAIQVLFLRGGSLVERKSEIISLIEEPEEELQRFISLFYEKHIKPKEIVVPHNINPNILESVLNVKVIVPQKGQKKQLVTMATTNAKISLENEFELITKDEEKINDALTELKKVLNISKVSRIELFDNSHLFGNFSVSGMVVFENGKPNKNEYRKYKITSVARDDYHLMQEVIYRRYFRVLKDKLPLADLIVVDGGIHQINAAKNVLQQLHLNIKVVGLKKDNKHNTNQLFDNRPLVIPNDSNLFFLLTRMQDEVHRYTINYHRQIRSKGSLESILDNVPGIGPVRKRDLIKKYGSIDKLKALTASELETMLPTNVVSNLYNYLHDNLPHN